MASIQQQNGKWRVQVYVNGRRESKVLATRKEAAAWALSREAELSGRRLPDKTLTDAFERYAREVSPTHRGERYEILRLAKFGRDSLAKRKIAGIAAIDLTEWRDRMLGEKRKPGGVLRDMNLMHSVLEHARRDWGWIKVNPMWDVRRPQAPKGRARRITQDEIDSISQAFEVAQTLSAEGAKERVGLAFLLAIETGMRSGEMLGLTQSGLRLDDGYVILQQTKNGDKREVPLTMRAREILRALPKSDGPLFGLDDRMRDAIWRKYRPKHLTGLHFHDTRAEAIWRLSKKLDVLQLARAIGHRDIKNLMIYYRESASDISKRLG